MLAKIERLNIPVPDAQQLKDDDESGQMFWIAWLTTVERLAEGGNIASARRSKLEQLARETAGMVDKGEEDAKHR